MVTVHIKENSIDGEELLKTGKLNLVSAANVSAILHVIAAVTMLIVWFV